VLARSPHHLDRAWRDRVHIVKGDAGDPAVVAAALAGADVAYYLLHSMDGRGDYVARDRRLATAFSDAAGASDGGRIIYLGGLHPEGVSLSPHLASRVDVGRILLASGVPTAVLQAGVVIGEGSASFRMLRHLTERLPVAVGPKWLRNRIQPIAVDDVVFYLLRAADLPPEVSGTFDIGMDEVFTYAGMMKRYARVTGLLPRLMGTVPVLTPGLASHWVGLVTPVHAGVAKPLGGSLINDAIKGSDDARGILGEPEGGLTGFDEAVRRATARIDPKRWGRTALRVGAAVAACAVAGSALTDPRSAWYRGLAKPAWQPPPAAFPVVWTALYAGLWAASTSTITELTEQGDEDLASHYVGALGVNLLLNAGWSGLFFRAHALRASTLGAAVLAVSSADLARRASETRVHNVAVLGAYAAWCGFATALTAAVSRRNR